MLVNGQIIYIYLTGSELQRMPYKLVDLKQQVNFKKYGDVYFFELIKMKRCCGLQAGELDI